MQRSIFSKIDSNITSWLWKLFICLFSLFSYFLYIYMQGSHMQSSTAYSVYSWCPWILITHTYKLYSRVVTSCILHYMLFTFYILFIFHCTILSFFRRTEYFRNTGMVLPELSRTMAYATRKTVNRLHLNHLVSERPKEE